jgi:hypothetical protein
VTTRCATSSGARWWWRWCRLGRGARRGAAGAHDDCGDHAHDSDDSVHDMLRGLVEAREERGVFVEGLGLRKGLGFSSGDADQMAVEEAVTGPVSDTRKKLTGGSHLSVAGRRRARTLSGAGDLLGWAGFLA